MSNSRLTNAEPKLSHVEVLAGALGLDVSRVLSRWNPDAPGNAIEVILGLVSRSGLTRAAAIWSETKGEGTDDKGFGRVDDPSEYTVGAYEDNYVLVYLGLAAKDVVVATESLRLLAELLEQQLGRFLAAQRLRRDNDRAQTQLRLDHEALQLRKTMERARALLARHGSMTPIQATEYLVSVSTQTNRSLLEVAERIVLAYGGPETGFRWRTSDAERRSATRSAVA